MLASRTMRLKPLGALCRRMATALGAGLDIRRVLEREAGMARGELARRLGDIRRRTAGGTTLGESLAADGRFPPLVYEMVTVGEQTGHLAEVFRQLADHYEFQLNLRRQFNRAVSWPAIQFGFALLVVGLLIVFAEFAGKTQKGEPNDLLGFGLVGTSGLVKYISGLLVAAILGVLAVRGLAYALQHWPGFAAAVARAPLVGRPMRTLALARFTWTMQLSMETEMELRKSIELALASTRQADFIAAGRPVWSRIASGGTLHDGLAAAGIFPRDMLDEVDVGEQSGRLAPTFATLARLYHAEAENAMRLLTTVAGWAVWAAVAAVIITLIFRLALTYFSMLQSLT